MATGTIVLPILGFNLDDTNPPAVQFSNNRPKLVFDSATDEIIYIAFRMPSDYASAPVLKAQYSMASAITLEVIIGCEVMAVSDGDAQDLDADSYDTVNTSAATTVPGTVGYMDGISLALTNADSLAAGDYVALKIRRDADNAGDDAAGDMEVWAISLEYTV